MIKILAFVLLLACSSGCEFKSNSISEGPNTTISTPSTQGDADALQTSPRKVRQVAYDFGLVEPNARHSGTVELINDSPEVISLAEARVSCGCLSVDSYPKVISPGKTGIVSLTFDSTQKSKASKVSAVLTDKQGSPIVFLEATAIVRSYWTSPENVGLGDLSKKTEHERLAVFAAGHDDAEVVEATCDADWLSVRMESSSAGSQIKDVKTLASLTVLANKTNAPLGILNANLRLRIRDGDAEEVLVVPVVANHYGNVKTVPARIVFGNVGQNVEKRNCQINFRDDVDLEAIEIVSEHPFVEGSIKSRGPNRLTIEVVATSGKANVTGLVKGQLVGRVDGNEEVFVVPYTGLFPRE